MYHLCIMDISKTIRTVREDKRLTQLEVAEKLQMERSNYARLEARGNKLSIEQLEQIARVLGVSVVELITGETQKIEDSGRVQELEKRIEELEQSLKEVRYLKEKADKTIQFKDSGLSSTKDMIEGVFKTSDFSILLESDILSNDMKEQITTLYNMVIKILDLYISSEDRENLVLKLIDDEDNVFIKAFELMAAKKRMKTALDIALKNK